MAYTDSEDLNYLGILYRTGARSTPFINAIGNPVSEDGSMNTRAVRTVNSFEFAVAQPYDTGAGSQSGITEADSVTGVAATTITRGQDTNTCQIFIKRPEVSYKKLSTTGTVYSGLAGETIDGVTVGLTHGVQGNPVQNELDWQTIQHMRLMASDLDYCCIQGSYTDAASVSTAAETRGLKNAITTNAVAAGTADLTVTHVNSCVKAMVDSGAPMMDVIALCNSFQLQSLAALYEYVPTSRTEGGSNIQTIYTNFGVIRVMYDPNMPTDSIYFVDLTVCRVVFCPIQGKLILVEKKPTDGASYANHIYFQAGMDYGPEEYHGKITGLTTS